MGFNAILKQIGEGARAFGVVLLDADGVSIAEWKTDRSADLKSIDVVAAGVEFASLHSDIEQRAKLVEVGKNNETILCFEACQLILRELGEGLHLVVALPADETVGRARYWVRRELLRLREEIEGD